MIDIIENISSWQWWVEQFIGFAVGALLSVLLMAFLVWICSYFSKVKRYKFLMKISLYIELFLAFLGFGYQDIKGWNKHRKETIKSVKKRLKK